MTILDEAVSEDRSGSSSRCTPREAAGNPTVSALLENDHRSIDAMFTDVEALILERNCTGASTAFQTFQKRLEAHIAAEELVLFPAFEEATACNGPTSVMRSEHGAFRRLMTEIHTALEGASERDPLPLFQELGRTLSSHNVKEERVLYPKMDANLDGGQRRELVSRIAIILE